MSKIEQPSWCDYPDAEDQFIGCWSLQFGMVKDESYCKECDCYRKGEQNYGTSRKNLLWKQWSWKSILQ